MAVRIQLRRDTAANWTAQNPTLAAGEVGVEVDTGKVKVGDGSAAWSALAYLTATLDDLTDVAITAAAPGDILRHNGTAWVDTPGTTHFEVAGAVAAHEADTTSVHGIADTSLLATTSDVSAAIATHAAAVDPHGDRAYALALVDDLSGVTDPTAARVALELPRRFQPFEARDFFAEQPDGFPASTIYGQPYTLWGGSSGPAARATVIGGKLTQSVTPAASYAQVPLARSCRRIGGRFSFGAGSGNGSAVLAAWADNISTVVPDCSIHLVTTPTQVGYGTFTGNVFTQLKSWTYATPLAQDGTVYTMEVVLDQDNDTAYVFLPDGRIDIVSHPSIGAHRCDVAVWEIFTMGADAPVAAFTETWADSHDPGWIPWARALYRQPLPTLVMQYAPAADLSVAVPASSAAIDAANLKLTVVAPPSGKILMEMDGMLAMTASTRVFWQVRANGLTLGTREIVGSQQTGAQHYSFLLTGLTPGVSYPFEWWHFAVSGTAATFRLHAPSGWTAVMKATPVFE